MFSATGVQCLGQAAEWPPFCVEFGSRLEYVLFLGLRAGEVKGDYEVGRNPLPATAPPREPGDAIPTPKPGWFDPQRNLSAWPQQQPVGASCNWTGVPYGFIP